MTPVSNNNAVAVARLFEGCASHGLRVWGEEGRLLGEVGRVGGLADTDAQQLNIATLAEQFHLANDSFRHGQQEALAGAIGDEQRQTVVGQ